MADQFIYIRFQAPPNNDEPVHIGIGMFNRSFNPRQQPFAVSETDWQVLKSSRLFELDAEAQAKSDEKIRKAAEKEAAKQA